jgi:hypothetical protein
VQQVSVSGHNADNGARIITTQWFYDEDEVMSSGRNTIRQSAKGRRGTKAKHIAIVLLSVQNKSAKICKLISPEIHQITLEFHVNGLVQRVHIKIVILDRFLMINYLLIAFAPTVHDSQDIRRIIKPQKENILVAIPWSRRSRRVLIALSVRWLTVRRLLWWRATLKARRWRALGPARTWRPLVGIGTVWWLLYGIWRSLLVFPLRATKTVLIIRGRWSALVMAVLWVRCQISSTSWTLGNFLVSEIRRGGRSIWRTRLRRRAHIRGRGVSIAAFQCSKITALYLAPDRARGLAMPAKGSVRVPSISLAERLVIPSSSDGSRTENVVQVVSIRLFLNPFSNGVEHVPVDLEALVSQSWVMEYTEDVIHHFINWDSWVLPGIDNSPKRH